MIFTLLLLANITLQPYYYTNTNYFYEVTAWDSIIFGATNGGVVAYDYLNSSFRILTNVDGLGKNSQTSIGIESSGYLWVGSSVGLAVIEPDLSSIHIYPSQNLASTNIQEIFCARDSIYIGSTDGLSFIDTRGTPADTSDDIVKNVFDTDGLPSNNVLSIAVDDTLIWVGTSEGLVHFKKDLGSPVQYDTSDGLLNERINKVFIQDTMIYVGTDQGLNCFRNDHFDTLLVDYEIKEIASVGESLALSLRKIADGDTFPRFGFYHEGALILNTNGIPYRSKINSITSVGDELFCGLGNRYDFPNDYYGEGIGRFDFVNGVWNVTKNRCLPSNHISEITANEQGIFVACGARAGYSRGFGWLNNYGEWTNFTRDSIIPSNNIHRCVTDPDGKVWFGINYFSCNGGDTVMVFSFDPSSDEWNFLGCRYNGMDSTVAVWDIAFDNDNNMYLALSGPSDKLWVIDSALNTVSYLGTRMPEFNVEIAIDSAGKIWRTLAKFGLLMFDPSDNSEHSFTESDGLISDNARGCAVDRNNNLYVATDRGLVKYNGVSFSAITDISFDDDILDIELDPQGRVWMMARTGIYYYDPEFNISDGYSFAELGIHIEFLDDPDEIIQVQGFEFDAVRGCFWLGGQTGLLKLAVHYETPVELEDVLIYPNPVVGNDIVRIKNIPTDSRITVFSVSGRKIAEDLEPDVVFGEVVWEIPDDVGSGLYFVLIKTGRGNKVCKLAIVR